MEKIPQEYIIQKFYQYAGYPKFKKISNVYEAGCPSCREGSSWGRKRRLYYIVDDDAICCHNCGWYGNPFKWIMEQGQLQAFEIYTEIEENDYGYIEFEKDDYPRKFNEEHLPKDSINLFDDNQLAYYKNNDIVDKALSYIKKRRLATAVNKCESLWISLSDFIHKNRIIIPFHDENDKIIHYQSRGLIHSDLSKRPKYLSKLNSDKSLFNYNQIDSSLSDIFIFEGPIDAFFVKNSIATAGIQENSTKSFSSLQQKQIDRLWLTNKIWVLDSQWQDRASLSKTKKLIQQGQTVFLWPKAIGMEFKDFNEMACKYEMDQISHKFIKKNSYKGMKADVILTQIK